jgi:hypothetical protein
MFRKAAKIYLARLKSQPEVIGVIFAGGWIRGIIDPNSDADIYVILDESCMHRQRGNTWIIEVDSPVRGNVTLAPQPNQGVQPDVLIVPTAKDLYEGNDPALQAALGLIRR